MWWDLSVSIAEGMPKIPSLPEVVVRKLTDRSRGDPLEIRLLNVATHVGTHVDAPAHRIVGGRTIDQIAPDETSGPAVVIPVDVGPGQAFGLEVLTGLEDRVQPGDIVLFDTGISRRWGELSYYDNPYMTVELARWLVERRVKLVGVDAITVDMPPGRRPPDFDFPVHEILLRNEVLICENLTNLSGLRGRRIRFHAFPLKIDGGDAGLVRAVATTES